MSPVNYAGTLRRNRRASQERDHINKSNPVPTSGVRIVTAVKSGATVTLTFNQVVTLTGTPKMTTDLPGVTAISATQPSPMSVVVTFSAAVTTATTLNVEYQNLAIRAADGGCIADSTFPLA